MAVDPSATPCLSEHHPIAALLKRLGADADALRAYALNADGTIKNPRVFERAVKLKLEVQSRTLKYYDWMVYEEASWDQLVKGLIEMSKEDVSAYKRTMARLYQMKKDWEDFSVAAESASLTVARSLPSRG